MVERVMEGMEVALCHTTHEDANQVFEVTLRSPCPVYDCEFVALVETLNVYLVTEGRQILLAFPDRARSMSDFSSQ